MKNKIAEEVLNSMKAIEIQFKDGFTCRANIKSANIVDNILTLSISAYGVNISGSGWNKLEKHPDAMSLNLTDMPVSVRGATAEPVVSIMNNNEPEYHFFSREMI